LLIFNRKKAPYRRLFFRPHVCAKFVPVLCQISPSLLFVSQHTAPLPDQLFNSALIDELVSQHTHDKSHH